MKTTIFFLLFLGMFFISGCVADKSQQTDETSPAGDSQEQSSGEDPTQIFEEDSEAIEDIEDIDVPLEEEDIV